MSFDAWVVAFGLSRVLRDVRLVGGNAAYLVLAAVVLLDGWLLYRFFRTAEAVDVSLAATGHGATEAIQPD